MTKKNYRKAFSRKSLLAFLFVFILVANGKGQTLDLRKVRIGNIKVQLSYKARVQVQKKARLLKNSPGFRHNKVRVASLHLPLIAQELRPLKVPVAFQYLALVNNPLKDSIKFWANAEPMASMLGLKVNASLDETLNIVMTSQAMAHYFRKKYKRNFNWVATLLSYAMTPYHIKRFLGKHYSYKTKTLKLDNDIPHFLLKFLATWTAYSTTIRKHRRYSVTLIKYDLVNNKSFARIGKEFSLPASVIQRYNAWFRGQVIPKGRKYFVVIPMPTYSPSGNVSAYNSKKQRLTQARTVSEFRKMHVVSGGETLYSIARLYGISVYAVKKWNGLKDSHLKAGQRLRIIIPGEGAPSSNMPLVISKRTKATSVKRKTARYAGGVSMNKSVYKKLAQHKPMYKPRTPITHMVRSGDNLYRISKKYNVSVAQIRLLNQMRDNRLFVGKRLIIRPAPGSVNRRAPNSGKAAASAPNVPATMYLAGVKLKLTSYARRLVQFEMNQLKGKPRFFRKKLERIQTYMPIIQRILHRENIPNDFKFLPILESSLIANAVSTSNAVGYWQFKKDAALEVGMQINKNVDERLNIVAATQGATRYLNRNHLFFQNWLYTLLSYNLGFAGTQNYLENRFVNYRPGKVKTMTIDGHTHWYIRRFLAHKLVFEKPLKSYIATNTRLSHFTSRKKSSLKQIARSKRIDIQLLRQYNQWLKTWQIPGDRSYTVILPRKSSR